MSELPLHSSPASCAHRRSQPYRCHPRCSRSPTRTPRPSTGPRQSSPSRRRPSSSAGQASTAHAPWAVAISANVTQPDRRCRCGSQVDTRTTPTSGTAIVRLRQRLMATRAPAPRTVRTWRNGRAYLGATTHDDNNACGGWHSVVAYSGWVTARDRTGETPTNLIDDKPPYGRVGRGWSLNRTGSVANLTVDGPRLGPTCTCDCDNHREVDLIVCEERRSHLHPVGRTKPGRTVAVVAPTSNTRGVMNISVDGGAGTAVNTYISPAVNVNRVVVWQRALAAGQHTLRIVNAGTYRTSSDRRRLHHARTSLERGSAAHVHRA